MSKAPKLQELLSGAQLPALPQSAIRLLQLSQDTRNGPAEFAVPIEADPGLTGQVLRFVNSSYFGFKQEICSVRQAIALVGIRTIKNFSLFSAVFSLMPNPRCGPFELKKLWQDSLRRGLFARSLGKLLGLKQFEEMFSAALLQDMAIPLLAKELPEQYRRLLDARVPKRQRLSALEQDEFGWSHADAAGIMARSWKLPEEFALMTESHTRLDEFLAHGQAPPHIVAVSLSALLPSSIDDEWIEREKFLATYDRITPDTAPPLAELFRKVDAEFEEFAPVLKLAGAGQSLASSLDVATAV